MPKSPERNVAEPNIESIIDGLVTKMIEKCRMALRDQLTCGIEFAPQGMLKQYPFTVPLRGRIIEILGSLPSQRIRIPESLGRIKQEFPNPHENPGLFAVTHTDRENDKFALEIGRIEKLPAKKEELALLERFEGATTHTAGNTHILWRLEPNEGPDVFPEFIHQDILNDLHLVAFPETAQSAHIQMETVLYWINMKSPYVLEAI